jgi:CheY-like chemotaxis protein
MDGTEVANRLRELHPALPILLSSGYSEMEVVSQSEPDPATAYLPKPYTVDELRLRIQTVLDAGGDAGDDWMDD